MKDCNNEMASWIAKKKPNELSDDVRNQLAASVVNLAKKITREHLSAHGLHTDREDAEGEAMLACVEASIYFDPHSGVGFTTYAAAWIRRALANWTVANSAQLARGMECPETIVDRASEADDEIVIPDDVEVEIDARQMLLLKQLTGVARDIVLLSVFAGQSPERIAVRLGMEVKDVKLVMRNSAGQLAGFMATYADDAAHSMFATAAHEE